MPCGCKSRARRLLRSLWEVIPYRFNSANEALLMHIREEKRLQATQELPESRKVLNSPIVAAERRGRFAMTRKRYREVLK